VIEAGEALIKSVGNGQRLVRYRVQDGAVGGPQATTSISGVSPLSLLTFFAAAKKVSAAPHRGNA